MDLDAILDDLRRQSRPRSAPDTRAEPPPEPEAPAGRLRERLRLAPLDPGRRGAGAMAIAAGLAAIATAAWVLLDSPSGGVTHVDPVAATAGPSSSAPPASTGGSVSPGTAAPAPSPSVVVVDVAGRVAAPGVYTLPAGSRVADALAAAGGAAPGVDLSSLNLARLLVDGEQVAVGIPGAPNTAGGSAGASGEPSDATVDLNRATAAMLDALPGVGPVLAQNILDWRAAHGRFDSVDQLREVSGIGEAKFAQLKGRVRV